MSELDVNQLEKLEEKMDGKFAEILAKLDSFNNILTQTRLNFVESRAATVEKFSTMVFESQKSFEEKLSIAERKIEERRQRDRDEFTKYKIENEKNVTSISVKVGIVFSILTSIVIGVLMSLLKLYGQGN